MPFKKISKHYEQLDYYNHSLEYYKDQLVLIDLKIRFHSYFATSAPTNDLFEPFKGLMITEEDFTHMLSKNESNAVVDVTEIEKLTTQIINQEHLIAHKLDETKKKDIFLPLEYLSQLFSLNYIEKQCIMLCLAVELDCKYEKIFGYLQDNLQIKKPTINLALELFCNDEQEKWESRKFFTNSSKLFIYIFSQQHRASIKSSSLSTELSLDERIINFLLENDAVDPRLLPFTEFFSTEDYIPELMIGQSFQVHLRECVDTLIDDELEERDIIIHLFGNNGVGKKTQLKHLCKHLQQNTLIIDVKKLLTNDLTQYKELIQFSIREALLQNAVLAFDQFDLLFVDDDSSVYLSAFLNEIQLFPDLIFLISQKKIKRKDIFSHYAFLSIELPQPNFQERLLLWKEMSKDYPLSEKIDWESFSNKFIFSPGQIEHSLRTAQYLVYWDRHQKGITSDHLHQGCYMQIEHNLENKSKRLKPLYHWDDLILPKEEKQLLRNACNQMKYRHIVFGDWGFDKKLSYGKGLSMLFAGSPGTGKTMSAEIVANELKLELYKVDLSQIVSKYIGETEKNLKEIFDEASRSQAILFFDETDALFGKRTEVKDAKDKYANIEVAYLLQKIEEYDGITILATNLLQNIDEAFIRRISFVIQYPFPDVEERIKLWKLMIPKETPVSNDIDFHFLGKHLTMAGGNIKNTVVTAAFLAVEDHQPLSMKHLIQAAKFELQKTGKVFLKGDLSEYADLLQDEEEE